MERELYKDNSTIPEIRMDDVLQSKYLTSPMRSARKRKSLKEWFLEGVKPFEGHRLVLGIVAEGIEVYPELVEYINKHSEWKVECHGLEHIRYDRLGKEEVKDQLLFAKQIIEDTFNQEVTRFFPPWGKTGGYVKDVCEEIEMWTTNHIFNSCQYWNWLKKGRKPERISVMTNFHYWYNNQNKCAEKILNWDYTQYDA